MRSLLLAVALLRGGPPGARPRRGRRGAAAHLPLGRRERRSPTTRRPRAHPEEPAPPLRPARRADAQRAARCARAALPSRSPRRRAATPTRGPRRRRAQAPPAAPERRARRRRARVERGSATTDVPRRPGPARARASGSRRSSCASPSSRPRSPPTRTRSPPGSATPRPATRSSSRDKPEFREIAKRLPERIQELEALQKRTRRPRVGRALTRMS